jgi:hypothetical protein
MATKMKWVLPLFLAAACTPDLGQLTSLVKERRILAVKTDPAEARPGQEVTYTALVVSPDGTDAAPSLTWALCLTPKPLDENNIIAASCLGGGDGVQPLGDPAPSVAAQTPSNACQLFGPDPPPQMQGKPPLRPRDPDASGGYYQPIRLSDGNLTGFALERIRCNLASAGADIAIEFGQKYQANNNPKLLPLTAAVAGQPVALGAIHAGQAVDFTASWPPDSVESYWVYNIVTEALDEPREQIRVSWFATDGKFDHERTGSDESNSNDVVTSTSNRWTAPTTPGVVHVWLVLRDSRGGVDYAGYDVTVAP